MRDKSAVRKRIVGIQEEQCKTLASTIPSTCSAPTHQFTNVTGSSSGLPLKSLLRVRLPPTGVRNGTLMSVYEPDQSPSIATDATPRSTGRKRVLFTPESAAPFTAAEQHSTDSGDIAMSAAFVSVSSSAGGGHTHPASYPRGGNDRPTKERRLSSASVTPPTAAGERQGEHLDNGIESGRRPSLMANSPSFSVNATSCITPALTMPVQSLDQSSDQMLPEWMALGRSYKGFCHFGSPSSSAEVPEIGYSSLSPKEFFEQYVALRRPCILKSDKKTETDLTPLLTLWTSNEYLKEKAGKHLIDVEIRNKSKGELFGEGRKTTLPFSQLLNALEQGKEKYYATTQNIKEDEEGPLYLGSDILWKTPLSNDFPNTPTIMGNLVPYQHNLWIGHSKEGSTSGLHHDYHDNFYVIIRGTKTFRLYSPRCAEALQTTGNIVKIHDNGLICYTGMHRSDGADQALVFQWRARQADKEVAVLKRRLEATETHIKNLSGLIRRASKIEERLRQQCKQNSMKRPLVIKDLATKKWMAIAKQFLLTSEVPVENLRTELNSKMESKKLLEDYIEIAMTKSKQFMKMKRNAEMKHANPHATEKNDNNNDGDGSVHEEHENESRMDGRDGWFLDEDIMEEEEEGMTTGTNSKRPSLELLEALVDDKMKAGLEAKRKLLLAECEKMENEVMEDDNSELSGEIDGDTVINNGRRRTVLQSKDVETLVDGNPANFCQNNTKSRHLSSIAPINPVTCFPYSSKQCPNERLEAIRNQMLERYLVVTLGPTDCLYLPASWFHEVISTSLPMKKRNSESMNISPGHMAFNYWLHPPAFPFATFTTPYEDEYWASHFRRTQERMQLENRLSLMRGLDMSQGSGDWFQLIQLLQEGLPPELLGLDGLTDDDDVDSDECTFLEENEEDAFDEGGDDHWLTAMMDKDDDAFLKEDDHTRVKESTDLGSSPPSNRKSKKRTKSAVPSFNERKNFAGRVRSQLSPLSEQLMMRTTTTAATSKLSLSSASAVKLAYQKHSKRRGRRVSRLQTKLMYTPSCI